MATGYSTLYGDSAGGFAVIKDVPKTLVYELCRYRNAREPGSDLIPDPVLTKAPSAELRPDQRDDESLPPYGVLDPVIDGYVVGDRSAEELVAEGFDPAAVARVVAWSTGPSTSAVRCRRGCGSRGRPSAGTVGCPSPTTTDRVGATRSDEKPRTGQPPAGRHPPLSEPAAARTQSGGPGRSSPPTSVLATSRPLADSGAAALIGEYRWIEDRALRSLGQWVVDIPLAAVQVHLDGQSMRHAWHAELWGDRLPVLTRRRPGP